METELRENKRHGTALYPFAKYGMTLDEAKPGYPMHWHEEMEIIRVQEGRGLVFIDGKRIEAAKGDIFVVNPCLLHALGRIGSERMTIESVVFDLRMLESSLADACTVRYLAPLLNRTHLCRLVLRPSEPAYAVVNPNITTLLMACNDRQEGYELAVKANLTWLLYHFYNKGLVHRKTAEDEEKYSDVRKCALDYIRENISLPLTVADIAKACGYSETYTMKLFRRMTGTTCVEYINEYRLKLAAERLRETKDKVCDVALSCGFNNVSYFNLQFRKAYKMTPLEYRNMKS